MVTTTREGLRPKNQPAFSRDTDQIKVAYISNDVRDKQKLPMLIGTERGNRLLPLTDIWKRLDVGWLRIDRINDQGKPICLPKAMGVCVLVRSTPR